MQDQSVSNTQIETTNNSTSGDRRIAKNAVMLYVRMLAYMIVGSSTSRAVLNVLGMENCVIFVSSSVL